MMDQPSTIEIVTAAREFLEKHAIPELNGRTAFHARVAVNALAIVTRELELGGRAIADELSGLALLLGQKGSLIELNRELCRRVRANELPVDDADLAGHLCRSTVAKVEIDQPTYSGFVHSPHRTAR
jgi:hypothetical protein